MKVILIVSACVWIVLLEGTQVLFKMVVVALVFAHDGAMNLIMMNLPLPLGISIEFLPLDELSFHDFFDTLLPLGTFVLIQALIDISYFLFRQLLVAFI